MKIRMARLWCRSAGAPAAGPLPALPEALPGYDQGDGRRRWRALDLGTTQCYVEADAPRIQCKEHEVVVAAVPWARHDAGFTRSFEDQVAWLTMNTSKTAICLLMRIAWRTVGSICAARQRGRQARTRPVRGPEATRVR